MNVQEIRELVLSGALLSAQQIDAQIEHWAAGGGPAGDGENFLNTLVEQKFITRFQAAAVRACVQGPYRLGAYLVGDKVAAGRLGTIYRAVQVDFNQPVCLKIFPASVGDDRERATRLARETRVALQVDHPHVVRTFQVGSVGKLIFLAIEDLQGETLDARLKRERKLAAPDACRLIHGAALGLAHLHDLDVIHRNLEPANVWVTREGWAKLMEFSAARDALAHLDVEAEGQDISLMSPDLLGSYDYMAPEQAAGAQLADARSDIYSLGCIFFHCLTGETPFPDVNPVRKMMRHAREPVRSICQLDPQIPETVAAIVETMLAKEPGSRYQSARDVAAALEKILELEEQAAVTTTDINPEFLKWAKAGVLPDEIHVVEAQHEFVDFLGWVAEHGEEEDDDEDDTEDFE